MRHPEIGEAVEDGGADVGLGDLSLGSAREYPLAQLLEAEHHVLGQASPVISAVLLPAIPPAYGDL